MENTSQVAQIRQRIEEEYTAAQRALYAPAMPLPNLELGTETLGSLKRKLDDMLQSEDWDKETPFDYNELHILYAAIHMYLVDLSLAGNQQLMPTCLQLCKHFSAVIEGMPLK